MSRYLLLFLLNVPFVLAGLLNGLVSFKMKRTTKSRFVTQTLLWIIILTGLTTAKPLYEWLFSNNLTASEPLSIFDVIQITAVVIVFYIANRCMAKVTTLERRVQDLHQELSIQLSSKKD